MKAYRTAFPHPTANRAAAPVLATLVAASCGGADVEGWVRFQLGNEWTTSAPSITATGTAFVPAGARCYPPGGIGGPPYCNCGVGDTARLTWSNSANGASGVGQASLPVANPANCTASQTWWRIADVPLEIGANEITVTLSDESSSGSGRLVVTRN